MRNVFVATIVLALTPALAVAQPSAPVVTKTDVIYGRVEGAALLANIAYPDGPSLKPAIISVHGGRWRAGNRADASSIKVTQWAEFGFFAMSIDYRLVGGSPAPAPVSRHVVRDSLASRARRGVPDRSGARVSDRPVGRRPDGLALRDRRRSRLSASRRLGEGAHRRQRGDQRGRHLRIELAVVGQPVDARSTGNVEEARRHASPINHVSPSMKPLLVIHSDDDKSVPVQQAADMVEKLKAAGVQHRYRALHRQGPHGDHR